MSNSLPRIVALERAFAMLEAVVADGGSSSVSSLAYKIGMPVSTAHRQVATLVEAGYLRSTRRGRHIAGIRLFELVRQLDEKQVIVSFAAPVLNRLAGRLQSIVQLGTLENDMVTYRLKTGHGANALFTRVGLQLEAYCSAVGKILLAHLAREERDNYLAGGGFVPLTPLTLTDPSLLASELDRVREQRYATDLGEIADGLACLAVPIRSRDGRVLAGISVSRPTDPANPEVDLTILPRLWEAAEEISKAAFV